MIKSLSHALNCLFSSSEIRVKLESGEISHSGLSNQVNTGIESNIEKKKKPKGKKGKKIKTDNEVYLKLADGSLAQTLTPIELIIPESLSTKPSQLWSRICHIANKRYGHHGFPVNINDYSPLSLKFNRLATLRDLLLTIGLQIESKDYEFSSDSV